MEMIQQQTAEWVGQCRSARPHYVVKSCGAGKLAGGLVATQQTLKRRPGLAHGHRPQEYQRQLYYERGLAVAKNHRRKTAQDHGQPHSGEAGLERNGGAEPRYETPRIPGGNRVEQSIECGDEQILPVPETVVVMHIKKEIVEIEGCRQRADTLKTEIGNAPREIKGGG